MRIVCVHPLSTCVCIHISVCVYSCLCVRVLLDMCICESCVHSRTLTARQSSGFGCRLCLGIVLAAWGGRKEWWEVIPSSSRDICSCFSGSRVRGLHLDGCHPPWEGWLAAGGREWGLSLGAALGATHSLILQHGSHSARHLADTRGCLPWTKPAGVLERQRVRQVGGGAPSLGASVQCQRERW